MRSFLARLFGRPVPPPSETPPPGDGWRCGFSGVDPAPWTVWNGPTRVAAFPTFMQAQDYARRQNIDAGTPAPVLDPERYCAVCGSRETAVSLRARGFPSCCPDRYFIRRVWAVTADPVGDPPRFRLWRPADGLETLTLESWANRRHAQAVADVRNKEAARATLERALEPKLEGREGVAIVDDHAHAPVSAVVIPRALSDEELATVTAPAAPEIVAHPGPVRWPMGSGAVRMSDPLSAFLDVAIPPDCKYVVGPLPHPKTGKWHVFDRYGPRPEGYTAKTNAHRAARRLNAL